MAFPPQYREPAPTLPSIIAPGPGRYRAHHDMPFGRSPALSLPGLDMRDDVPPPLPPPRILPFGDSPHPSEHTRRDSRAYNASSSFASGYGSMASSHADDRPSFKRRDTGSTANGDEGYASYASTDRYGTAASSKRSGQSAANSSLKTDNPLGLVIRCRLSLDCITASSTSSRPLTSTRTTS